jgi:solute carrier family 25 oxoglutarate transporter 11
MSTPKKAPPSNLSNFLIGGASGMIATSVILPMDYIKVHMQVAREGKTGGGISPMTFAKETLRTKGWKTFYTGLDSALMRQIMYASVRLGLYKSLCDMDKEKTGSSVLPFWKKALYSCVSGTVGSIVGNPADLALIRLQTDLTLPEAQRRHYKHFFDAVIRIPREEGILAYWRGCLPTVIRATAMNLGMLAPYDQAKEMLDHHLGFSSMNRIYASLIAALCACLASLPFDNVKTKYQRMAKNPDGTLPYSGFMDCCMKSMKREGLLGFYVGLGVYIFRVGPHAIITLLTQDFLHHLFD